MKKTSLIASIVGCLAVSGSALAGPSQATLKLEGTLVPASCSIYSGGVGAAGTTIPLGKISFERLNQDDITQLGQKTTQVIITCPAATTVGFEMTDTAAKAGEVVIGTVKAGKMFSLGATKEDKVIGGYTITFGNASVDQKPVRSFLSQTSDAWNVMTANDTVNPNRHEVYSWTTSSQDLPSAGENHQVSMVIKPFINPLKDLGSADQIDIKGSATYDLVYL